MKTFFVFVTAVFLTVVVFAQETIVETTFWVRGNCPGCEKRIEKALKNVDDVQKAEWDQDSGNATVAYDSTETNQDAMEQAVAAVGYATKNHKADKAAHDKLPKCCREGYEKHID